MKKDTPKNTPAPAQSGEMVPQHKRMAMGMPVNGMSPGGKASTAKK